MTENHITLSITQAQVDTILAGLKTLDDSLPGLIELSPEQRKTMSHYSDKDLGFILKTLSLAEQHPEIFPSSFNLDAMRRDVDTQQKLETLLHALTLLIGKFQDSHFAAASQSFVQGRTVYQFVKTHNNLTGGLEDALADLAKHFAHNKAAKPDTPTKPDKPAGA